MPTDDDQVPSWVRLPEDLVKESGKMKASDGKSA
jgi:hypothetical protein